MSASLMLVTLLFAAAPPRTDLAAKPGPDVVALVGGVAIHRPALDSAMLAARANPMMFGSALPRSANDAAKVILDQLIAAELLAQEAHARGIEVSEAEVDAYMKDLRSHFSSEKDFQDDLKEHGLSEAEIRADAKRQTAIKKLLEKDVIPKVPMVDDKAAREFYDANPFLFTEPAEIRCAHVMVVVDADFSAAKKAAARKKIEKVLAEAKAGKDFAALAKAKSEDEGSRARGGDVGFVRPGEWPDEFVAAANALEKKGDLSGIVETRFGLHVIKLLEKLPPHLLPFDDKLKAEIIVRLDHRHQEEATLDFVDALRKQKGVQIFL